MKVEITGRHIEITEPLRKFATDRAERMHSVGEEIVEAHFILTVEKHQRHSAEVKIKTKHDFYHCEDVSTDMYTSIAAALEKLEKQILHSKGKAQARRRAGREGNGVVQASSASEVEQELGHDMPRIIRSHDVAAKPMSIDDAAVTIDDSEHEFLVFRNAQTEKLNVVYKRKDGNIGWIEPEA